MATLFEAALRYTPGPLLPQPSPGPSPSPSPSPAPTPPPAPKPAPSKKADYVGMLSDGDQVYRARAFGRHKISDRPSGVTSARLKIYYVDKAQPAADVALLDITDFDTLEPADWGAVVRATITASALTPASVPGPISLDVTTRYNQAKTDGLTHFAWMLQYGDEDEGVGVGRWYRVGSTGNVAPILELVTTAGEDLRIDLLATSLTVDLARADESGTPAAVLTAGDGDTYPPLGEGVRLAVTLTAGLTDDGAGTYTGTPSAPIVQAPDLIRFLLQSPDEGCGLTAAQVDLDAFTVARSRLSDWFALAGGLTAKQDVREWLSRIARSARAFVYVDQDGRESIYVEPLGGTGATPVRLVQPWEHGALRLSPLLAGGDAAQFPISRVEVFYAPDLLGLTATGWFGQARIGTDATDPPDARRQAEAQEAETRYGLREAGDRPAQADPSTGYEFVPLDVPGTPTGVAIRDWLWDRAQQRARPAEVIEVELPRFALGWRLLDEFELESATFPSAHARLPLVASGAPLTGSSAYQGRRARCQVRAIPRLIPESGPEFPVQIVAQVLAWDTA